MLDLTPEKLTIIGLLAALVTSFIKGWVVPGFVYHREVARNDKLSGLISQAFAVLHKVKEP